MSTPYSAFNISAMSKLIRAMVIVSKIISEMSVSNFPLFIEADELLEKHSFTSNDINRAMWFGYLSILQAGAQLTSDAVAGETAEKLMVDVMTQNGSHPSLMVKYAVALPPAVLGEFGSTFFIRNPLTQGSNSDLIFSPQLKRFIHESRARFNGRVREDTEQGHGCPIARTCHDNKRSGLQYFLDAILFVYSKIDDEM